MIRAVTTVQLAMLLSLPTTRAFAYQKPPDFDALARRISSQHSEEDVVQCLLLDTMVPRQRIDLQFGPPVAGSLSDET